MSIIIALLTAAAILAVLAPLSRAPKSRASATYAANVYRDQLEELARDRTEGRISAVEAETARAEIARRLIAVDNEARVETVAGSGAPAALSSPNGRRAVAVAALVGIPLLSLGLYLGLGAPGQPGEPLAARLAAPVAPDDIQRLVAKVEEHLAKTPEDGRGWEVIAPVYLRLGRAEDAAQAYRTAIRLLGSSAERQQGLGEAILAAQDGIVTADARAAFEAAEAFDPEAPGPRFYLGLAAEQEGKREVAATAFRQILSEAPADVPWREPVAAALARVAPGEAPPSLPGPTPEQVAAAQDMPAGDQAAMIDSMVTRLAARLKDEPGDVEGWLRLIRSYVVLGRMDSAADAARSALAGVGDDNARQRVQALLADLGVTPAGAATP